MVIIQISEFGCAIPLEDNNLPWVGLGGAFQVP